MHLDTLFPPLLKVFSIVVQIPRDDQAAFGRQIHHRTATTARDFVRFQCVIKKLANLCGIAQIHRTACGFHPDTPVAPKEGVLLYAPPTPIVSMAFPGPTIHR